MSDHLSENPAERVEVHQSTVEEVRPAKYFDRVKSTEQWKIWFSITCKRHNIGKICSAVDNKSDRVVESHR